MENESATVVVPLARELTFNTLGHDTASDGENDHDDVYSGDEGADASFAEEIQTQVQQQDQSSQMENPSDSPVNQDKGQVKAHDEGSQPSEPQPSLSAADQTKHPSSATPSLAGNHEQVSDGTQLSASSSPILASTSAQELVDATSQAKIEASGSAESLPERNITVHVTFENGETRDVTVTVVPLRHKKPFLGGFRSKKTGVEYHNANSQTQKRIRPRNADNLFHRQTQTVQVSSGTTNNQQTSRSSSTQMTKPGCFVSSVYDHVVVPRSYRTADEVFASKLKKVVLLQSCWRRWLAQRFTKSLRLQRQKFADWKQNEIQRKIAAAEAAKADTLQRRLHPAKKQDFDLLLQGLQAWRQEQMAQIATLPADQQARARSDLQLQETRYLTSIERLRFLARTQNKETNVSSFLDKTAEPRQWESSDGKVVQMETLGIRRARELRDLYKGLQMTELTKEERLTMLATIRTTILEHDTKLTKDIAELLNREEDLLKRNIRGDNLEGLRKRTLNLFLLFCETPEFNPEAARLLKVYQKFSADVRLCAGCGRFLSLKAFDVSPAAATLGKCRQCSHVHNVADSRRDPSPYERMLRLLQQDEARRPEPSRLCFLFGAEDMRVLAEQVWGARSILSQTTDASQLVLVRWDASQPWAPWNSVLLTASEAAAHASLESPALAYAPALVARVRTRSLQARTLFRRLADQEEAFAAE